jgi:plasmid stabilization system protein ParE
MIRSVVFRREARREFDEAADWYESNQKVLGKAFTEAIQDLLRSACSNPCRHPRVFEDVHEGLEALTKPRLEAGETRLSFG